MSDPLIGPGDNDYGRKPVVDAFNPGLGSLETTGQMAAVIALRNVQAIDAEIKEFQRLRVNPMKCPCGFDTIEFAVHEVASLHLCPNCRKVHCDGPDGISFDIVNTMGRQLAAAREGLKAADVALSRDFHPESHARQTVTKALAALTTG